MTVDQPTTIDGMGFDPRTGSLVLVVYDHLDWTHEQAHLDAIAAKITAYMGFLQSGQAREHAPDRPPAAFAHPTVRISLRVPPTPLAIEGLGLIGSRMQQAGVTLVTEHSPGVSPSSGGG